MVVLFARLPLALTLFRMLAGPTLVLLGLYDASLGPLIILVAAGLASDIADGIIARRLGVASLGLRRLDTQADAIFYGGATAAAVLRAPDLLCLWLPWLAGYIGLFVLRNAVDFHRYRASPAYHMWSGKLCSLLVVGCLVTGLLGIRAAFLPPLAFALYAINAVEGVIATLVLPTPCRDIPTVWHALIRARKLRQPAHIPN